MPRKLIHDVLRASRDDPLAGHFAVKHTLQRLRTMYCWNGMAFDSVNGIAVVKLVKLKEGHLHVHIMYYNKIL